MVAESADTPRQSSRSRVRRPNHQLRQARLARPSPSGSGDPMSRQELADAVNAYAFSHGGRKVALDETYIGKLERGDHRWPCLDNRKAFRAVLGVDNDADLGFFARRRSAKTAGEPAVSEQVAVDVDAPPSAATAMSGDGSTTNLVVPPGMAVVMLPAGHPLLLRLVAGT